MTNDLNGCQGPKISTPQSRYNRPGLEALIYRVGLYHHFLETMQARLTTMKLTTAEGESDSLRPLHTLTTRDSDDPAIAMLDAWAVVADILSFYQERLANEGFLRTATERRSIMELARLVGYKLRPGVAASVFLAFSMEKDFVGPVPAGTRVQSLPGPDELPQTFETAEALAARAVWNAMKPRLSQPQIMDVSTHTLYLAGTQVNLSPNDPVVVVDAFSSDNPDAYFRRVYEITSNPEADHTRVLLRGDLVLDKLEEALAQASPTNGEEDDDIGQLALVEKEMTTPIALARIGDTNPPTLSWTRSTSVTGIDRYQVFIKPEAGPDYEEASGTYSKSNDTVTFSLNELMLPGEQYEWYVEATDNLSVNSPVRSESSTFLINNDAIISDSILEDGTVRVHSRTPKFYWAKDDDASSYTFKISQNTNFDPLHIDPPPNIQEETFSITADKKLDLGRDYHWKVTTEDENIIVSEGSFTVDKALPADGATRVNEDTVFEWKTFVPPTEDEEEETGGEGEADVVTAAQTEVTYILLMGLNENNLEEIYRGPNTKHQLKEDIQQLLAMLDESSPITLSDRNFIWKVQIEGQEEDHISTRNFSLADPIAFANLQPHLVGDVPIDTEENLTWQIDWDLNSLFTPEVIYQVEFGEVVPPNQNNTTRSTTDNQFSISSFQLGEDKTYYWQVTATINFNDEPLFEVKSSIGSFTTQGETHKTLHDEFVKHIRESLLRPLISRLGDRTASTAKLQAEVSIEQYRIGKPDPLDEDDFKGDAAYIADAFDGLSESRWDFEPFINWVELIYDGLGDVEGQSTLRRVLQRTSGRVFVDEYIDLVKLEDIEKTAQAVQIPAQGDLNRFANDILTGIQNTITDEFSTERLTETNEDEKIVTLKDLIGRVSDLKNVISSIMGDEENPIATAINALADALNKTITKTKQETDQAITDVVSSLQIPPSIQPSSSLRLERNIEDIFPDGTYVTPEITGQILTSLQPELEGNLYQAWQSTSPVPISPLQGIEVLKVKAGLYGASLPAFKPQYSNGSDTVTYTPRVITEFVSETQPKVLTLDGDFSKITPGSWVVVEWIAKPALEETSTVEATSDTNSSNEASFKEYQVESVQTVSKPNYGKVTQLTLDKNWMPPFLEMALNQTGTPNSGAAITSASTTTDLSNPPEPLLDLLEPLRRITVYAQSEAIPLAEEPISDVVAGDEIQIDGLYAGLKAGRWLIVSGERADIPNTEGVRVSELVMLASVSHRLQEIVKGEGQSEKLVLLPGDTLHTYLKLANALAYRYKRDTVTIHGNVVKATHGETRTEVLGSGDGSQERQAFTLKQPPLTYLAAPSRAGVASTLEVRVNDIRWHEAEALTDLDPNARGYVTETDNESNTTIIFGDGKFGARLPSGVENVKAIYRQGIGKDGNVGAEKISLLSTRPLGVKEVINPLPASGGANREGRDQARWNVPLALLALDRLVSLKDYEDFTRTFAGISKAKATQLTRGAQQIIHLTIAGLDDAIIAPTSDLYRGLFQALQKFGTLRMPIQIDTRERTILVIQAGVHLHPDYLWESVEPKLRQALLDRFSFAQQELGQSVSLSDVISTMQSVVGVNYVDVDILDSVAEGISLDELKSLAKELTLKDQIDVKLGRVQTQHIVERGNETPLIIAQRYGITYTELKRLNEALSGENEQPDKPLDQGTKIRIPKQVRAAQIAYLSPDIPDTLLLTEVSA